MTAWLVTRVDKTSISKLMRIAWRTVGRICERVVAEALQTTSKLNGLRSIGIDEVSYKRRHKYLTVVINHETGELVWAARGKDVATVRQFFDQLGEERAARIELVSSDAAHSVVNEVARRCPNATLCLDPFHIIAWASRALDTVRKQLWREMRRTGNKAQSLALQRSRFALWSSPENLTDRQQLKLTELERVNKPIYRAYLLKEQLREVFRLKGRRGTRLLDRWLKWASRSRLEPFVELGRRIRHYRDGIDATLEHGLSNARVEAANTSIRLLTRLAFGFHSAESLIAIAMLRLGGLCPKLPAPT